MYTFEVQDCNERKIEVGMRCLYGSPPKPGEVDTEGLTYDDYVVEVTSITDPDGDYDDELERGVLICPRINMRFLTNNEDSYASTHRTTKLTWADYPDGPMHDTFQADDLEVIS